MPARKFPGSAAVTTAADQRRRPRRGRCLSWYVWCAGAVAGILLPGLAHYLPPARFLPSWTVWAGLAVMVSALLVQYAGWLARLPGGLKGWRLGLLAFPGFGVVWGACESFRCVRHLLHRNRIGQVLWGIVAGLAFAALAAALLWILWRCRRVGIYGLSRSGGAWGFFMAWAGLWGMLAWRLNRAAWRFEIVPTSSFRRRTQLALLLGLGWAAPLLIACGWYGWHALRLQRAFGEFARLGAAGVYKPLAGYDESAAMTDRLKLDWSIPAEDMQALEAQVVRLDPWLFDTAPPLDYYFIASEAVTACLRLALQALEKGEMEAVLRNFRRLQCWRRIAPSVMDQAAAAHDRLLQAAAEAGALRHFPEDELREILCPEAEGEPEYAMALKQPAYLAEYLVLDPENEFSFLRTPGWLWIGPEADAASLMAWSARACTVDAAERGMPPEFLSFPRDDILHDAFRALVPDILEDRDREVRLLRIGRLALAAERYRRQYGRYPESPHALTPEFLAALPTDPVSGTVPDYRFEDRFLVIGTYPVAGRDPAVCLRLPLEEP